MGIARVEVSGENMVTGVTARERIRGFILEKFPLTRKQGLKDSDRLLETGLIDSLGILDLVAFLEAEFGLIVSDEELLPENFQSVECIAQFVDSKRDGAS
jgi:acyl carrier protein